MNDLRLGVIGAGRRGGLADLAHAPGQGSRVVAVCDTRSEAFQECRDKYGSDIFTTEDYRQLVAQDLDGVFILSPDHLHEEHVLAALAKGLAVYLEKPMAITIEGCDRILRAAGEKGARLFVGHNMRYMSIVRKMKHLVDQGAIGQVKAIWCRHFVSYGGDAYFRDWHAERRYSTGLLLQKGAHDIDVMHYLGGGYTTRVSAFGSLSVYGGLPTLAPGEEGCAAMDTTHWPPEEQSGFNPRMDVEDQNAVIMQMENGILGSYLQCHFTPDCCRNYTIIGTKGRIENVGDGPESPIFLWNRRTDTYNAVGDEVFRGGSRGSSGHGGSDELIVKEFLRYTREGGATEATPLAARMAVAVGCCATQSLRDNGAPIDVPPYDG